MYKVLLIIDWFFLKIESGSNWPPPLSPKKTIRVKYSLQWWLNTRKRNDLGYFCVNLSQNIIVVHGNYRLERKFSVFIFKKIVHLGNIDLFKLHNWYIVENVEFPKDTLKQWLMSLRQEKIVPSSFSNQI